MIKTLLSTTAIVGALAFAAPAIAGGHGPAPVDVVLNGQFNFHSATEATGVDVGGKKVKVDVKNIDVLAVGNLNDTVANGGGSTFDLTHSSTSDKTKSSTKTKSGHSFDLSYESKKSYSSTSMKKSFSLSGSAWSKASTRSTTRSRTEDFGISKTSRNRVFVGSLQVNAGSPTTAIGVDAGGKKVNVNVKNLNVTAVGNMNSTKLK